MSAESSVILLRKDRTLERVIAGSGSLLPRLLILFRIPPLDPLFLRMRLM